MEVHLSYIIHIVIPNAHKSDFSEYVPDIALGDVHLIGIGIF